MLCPKCGQELPEENGLCPVCGEETQEAAEVTEVTVEPQEETLEETPVEETPEEAPVEETPAEEAPAEETAEETAEEAPVEEEPAEETPAEEPKKKSPLAAVLVAVIVLLVIIVTCLGLALSKVSKGESLPSLSQIVASIKPDSYHGDDIGVTVTDAEGNVVEELTNNQFAFYYWGEYYYYVNYYGLSFDATVALDQQMYDETMTWHDYFVSMANTSITQIAALKAEAQSVGFTMPEDYQAEYEAILEAMPSNAANTGFADEEGNGDVLAYIQDSYGPDTTVEEFEAYLYDSYYVSAYSDEIYYAFSYDAASLEEYYDANVDYFQAYGIEKSESPNINVRHILVEPVADEDGTISDEAWATAKEEAERILQEWKDGDATEDSFAELANTYSTDGGSNTVGGLYQDVYPGQMVTNFNDWCFDSARQTGDTDIVETDFGYHIMYFVSTTDEYYWQTVTDSEKRYEDYMATVETITASYTVAATEDLDVKDPDAVILIQENAKAEAAASTADSAAG